MFENLKLILEAKSEKLDTDLLKRIKTECSVYLQSIEDNKVDQHEGSVMVGKILKELYIDSATKRADNINKEHELEKIPFMESKKISWKEYKQIQR
jgi:hypothetical protein